LQNSLLAKQLYFARARLRFSIVCSRPKSSGYKIRNRNRAKYIVEAGPAGFVGSYPNFFFSVAAGHLTDFIGALKTARNDAGKDKFYSDFGVR